LQLFWGKIGTEDHLQSDDGHLGVLVGGQYGPAVHHSFHGQELAEQLLEGVGLGVDALQGVFLETGEDLLSGADLAFDGIRELFVGSNWDEFHSVMREFSNQLRVAGEVGEGASGVTDDLLREAVAESEALKCFDHGWSFAVAGHGEADGPGAQVKGNEDGHGVTGFTTALAVVTNPDLT